MDSPEKKTTDPVAQWGSRRRASMEFNLRGCFCLCGKTLCVRKSKTLMYDLSTKRFAARRRGPAVYFSVRRRFPVSSSVLSRWQDYSSATAVLCGITPWEGLRLGRDNLARRCCLLVSPLRPTIYPFIHACIHPSIHPRSGATIH